MQSSYVGGFLRHKGLNIRQTMSLPSLPAAPQQPDSGGQAPVKSVIAHVPAEFKALDYWQAIDLFNQFGGREFGYLDRKHFHKLVASLTRRTGEPDVSSKFSDTLFAGIDLDGSGQVEEQEFLSWTFGTFSNFAANVRRRLHGLNTLRALLYLEGKQKRESVKADAQGWLDKPALHDVVNHMVPQAKMSREMTDEIFRFVAGPLQARMRITDFLLWLRPDLREEELEMTEKDRETARALRRRSSRMPVEEKESALFEVPPGESVRVHFEVGDQGKGVNCIKYVKTEMKKRWRDQAYATVDVLKNCEGVKRVVVKVGFGIVLWDRVPMMTRMDTEDPFFRPLPAWEFIGQILEQRMPVVERRRRR